MKKGLWITALASLYLFNTSSLPADDTKSLWEDYEYVRVEEVTERQNPYHIEYRNEVLVIEETERIYKEPENEKEGVSYMAEKVKEGNHTQLIATYQYVYNREGVLLSKNMVPDSTRYYQASEMVYEYGSEPKVGVVFSLNKITKYGSDCSACNADIHGYSGTASGVATGLTSIRQSDGQWQDGITYDGYYIVASSKNIPMCTVLEITGHSFSGMGLVPGEPFQAIVLDRGVKDGILDLFVGSEYRLEIVQQTQRNNDYLAEIIALGTWTKNNQGQRICEVEKGPHE